MHKITAIDIAKKFNISLNDLYKVINENSWPNLGYEKIVGKDAETLINEILNTTNNLSLRVAGRDNNQVWENGWREIFNKINLDQFHPSIIKPQYFDHHKILRFEGNFIKTLSPDFLFNIDDLIRRVFFWKYIDNPKKIVELGCGTGNSQIILSEIFPDTELVAADWAEASQDIIKLIGKFLNKNIKAVNFNMLTLEGSAALEIDKDTCVLTVHSLEQLGSNYGDLFNFLFKARPKYVVHIEPILEFYKSNLLFDRLAIAYHKKRNYLNGFMSKLREFQLRGEIEIINEYRFGFGDRYHEAYSLIKWRSI